MSNFTYKVGDKVRIKDIDWYNKNKNILGNVECGDALMTFEKARFCGKIVTISSISDVIDTYGIEEDNGLWRWTDEMFEGLVEKETKFDTVSTRIGIKSNTSCLTQEIVGETKSKPKFKVGDKVKWYNHSCNITSIDTDENTHSYLIKHDDYREDKIFAKWVPENELTFEDDEETKPNIIEEAKTYWDSIKDAWICPDGYIFKDENGSIINATKIVLEKKRTVEEKYSDVKIQIFGNVVILKGGIDADNPTEYMNEVVHYILNLLGKPKYNQFIEDYLDNPWVRILIFDFNSMEFNNSFDDIVTNFKRQ